jgi:SAM-dependent methyltransferase
VTTPNLDRFSGFADEYDTHRPSPPPRLGMLLARYAGSPRPDVVDLGSGTGLSTRWASTWAASVVGVEPNDDMRARAEARPAPSVSYRRGTSHDTGLADRSADVVLAVQALHWMEPASTFAEVARLLRPGGVFAAVDADWPPVSGLVDAEAAWAVVHRRIRVFEARAAAGDHGEALRRPIDDDDPSLADEDLHDPHRNRAMVGNARSWSKSEHLARMRSSGHFRFTRELLFDEPVDGGVERFVALMRSQGSYQGLRRLGLTDAELGVDAFEADAQRGFGAATDAPTLGFSWRVRLGCR